MKNDMTAEDAILQIWHYKDKFDAGLDADAMERSKDELEEYVSSRLAKVVEAAYREGFQDGREWAMDDSEVGEDAYWEKSQARSVAR